MIVRIDKSFEKDANKINDKKLLNAIADCIDSLEKVENIKSIRNIKKLKGTNDFYRIRIGDYRIGLEMKNNTVELIRFCTGKKYISIFLNRRNRIHQ